MHANVQWRHNPATGEEAPYYRLKESYRDVCGTVHSLVVLNIGFEPALVPRQMRRIAAALTSRFAHRHQKDAFGGPLEGLDPAERDYAERFWRQMITDGQIDRFDNREEQARQEAGKYIDLDTVRHTDAREVGAEWLCKQAIDQLRMEEFLRGKGWTKLQTDTALSHLIVRTVYAPSELATLRIMADNSAACELYSGLPGWVPGKNSLYGVADRLLEVKGELERHLCSVTDDLFNQKNRIVLFDLTNFYFEGSKRGSKKAKFGRSKEKRSDCKLLVLALCVNTAGFPRYSEILEGNTSDPKSLPEMVKRLSEKAAPDGSKPLVVIDAGIATEDNLLLLRENGFDYLCVSRTRPKDYELSADHTAVTVLDSRKLKITLREVRTEPSGDYLLEITSPSKAMTESSMNRQWRERFEGELEKIRSAVWKKGGTKNYEKVIERVGRAREKYPSVAKFYDIEYQRDEKKKENMGSISWTIRDLSEAESGHGVYFLRTNVRTFDEKTTWDYYNLIREIECTNRQLKTDLNLRPIYHQRDDRSDAHLFLGMLAYWVVNTIRHQLKGKGENAYWTEIVRRMSTQKLVTTTAFNALGEKVELRQCSEPSKQAREIYRKLGYKEAPFRKMKICRSQRPPD